MSPFQHEAMFYDGVDGFLAGAVPFIRAGVAGGEPVMVAVDAGKIARLREQLGADEGAVHFVDMPEIGRNPGRIIPAWHRFLDEEGRPGRPIRGIGEPIWAQRSPEELVECQLHEALLNVAFAGADGFRLLCPYDTGGLGDDVLHEARHSHPVVVNGCGPQPSDEYRGIADPLAPFAAPLPPAPAAADTLGFERSTLPEVRRVVAERSMEAGLAPARVEDLVLAVNELATNSVLHGGGRGILRLWRDADALQCEVRDRGRIDDPLVGRRRQSNLEEMGGWGVWIAHHVCDLVQLRSGPEGTVVRLRMHCA